MYNFYFDFFLNENVHFVVEISEKSCLLAFTKSTGKNDCVEFRKSWVSNIEIILRT